MPKLNSNRNKKFDKSQRKDNLMSGMGSRLRNRYEAEERTVKEKVKRNRDKFGD